MSAHDYMSRSGYGEDVHKFPVVDAEGKPGPITGNGRILGTRTYVIKSYVEEIQRRRAVYPTTSATKSKESQPYNNSYGRPLEVQDLLSKIMTEVNRNGPPPKTSDPNPGTYNQGRPHFPPEPRARASDPNLGRVRYSFPVNEGTVDYFEADHGYGPSPAKVDPMRGYGYDYNHGNPDNQWGKSSSPVYDRPHQGGYGAPNHQWGGYDVAPRSSSPIYDRRTDKFPKTPSHGKLGPPKDQEVHKNGWGGSLVKPQTPYEYDVPRDDISTMNPKEYGIPDTRGGNPEARDYGVPSNKWDKLSSPVYDHPGENPERRWDGYARNTQTPGEYGVPSNQWERSSSPIYDHPQNNPPGPKNQLASPPMKPESPREHGVVSNPKNQWGPPVKIRSPDDYGVPDNQWERSSSPNYQRGSPHVKPRSPRDYGVPSNQWEKSSNPKYQKGPPHVKLQSPGDYGVLSDQWESSLSPKYQRGSPPVKPQSPRNYEVPSNQWERSSSPRYQKGSPPLKPQSPGDYGAQSDQWENSSSPKYQRGSPPVKPPGPGHYGALSNQQGRSSSPVYDYPQKSSSKNQWGSSPLKPQSPRVSTTNQWDRSSSPTYDHQANEGHRKPPEAICKDGVCTLNDKPFAPQGTHAYEYDVPKDNRKGFPITSKPISYPDDQHYGSEEGWRMRSSNPNIPDHQPTTEFGKSTNQKMPSGSYNNMGEALSQLSLDSPRGTGPPDLQGSRRFTIAPTVGPRQDAAVGPGDIESRDAVRRYGGSNFAEKPYAIGEDQKRILTSKEAIDKYNGSFVPK